MSLSVAAFFINIILFASAAALVFVNTGQAGSRAGTFIKKRSKVIYTAGTALSVLLLILDAAGAVPMSGYRFLSLAGIAGFPVAWLSGKVKFPEKFQHIASHMFKSLMVCLALEIFVFNINSAYLLSGGYPESVFGL